VRTSSLLKLLCKNTRKRLEWWVLIERYNACVSAATEPDLQRRNDHLQEPDICGRPVTSQWRHRDVTTTHHFLSRSQDPYTDVLLPGVNFVENLRGPFPFSLFLLLFSSCSLLSSPFVFISLPPHPFYRSISAKSAKVLVECCEFSQSVWAQLYLKLHSVHFKRNRNASGEYKRGFICLFIKWVEMRDVGFLLPTTLAHVRSMIISRLAATVHKLKT